MVTLDATILYDKKITHIDSDRKSGEILQKELDQWIKLWSTNLGIIYF